MMGKEFQLINIETHVLKVHIHCDGCARKVKKILKKIEGVYTVSINAEDHKVKVSGNVDSATLIKKLTKSRKHAELWSPTKHQNQKDEELTTYSLLKPLMAPDHDWSAGMNSGMPEANFGAAMLGNSAQSGWREYTTPDAEAERYHGYYSPFSMRNKMMNLESSPFFPNYDLYSPSMISNNIQQYQGSPAYDYFSPAPTMINNMQQYYPVYPYTLPSPTIMNMQQHYSSTLPSPTMMINMQQYYPSPRIQDVSTSYFPRMFDDSFYLPRQL